MKEQTLQLANSGMMWTLSIIFVSLVVIQTALYYKLAEKYSKESGMLTNEEIKKSVKIGAIGTIGPAVAVFAIAVALIAQIGGPITLSRVGVIGSAHFEMVSAGIGSMGTMGTDDFTPKMLSTMAWVMAFGGSGWMLMTLIATKNMGNLQQKLKATNPLNVSYMASFAPFIIFFNLAYNQFKRGIGSKVTTEGIKSWGTIGALLVGAIAVIVVNNMVEKDPSKKWLKEWSMAFAVIAAMIVGSLLG